MRFFCRTAKPGGAPFNFAEGVEGDEKGEMGEMGEAIEIGPQACMGRTSMGL